MQEISSSLKAMGVEQYLMAFLFLASYSTALSDFTGVRGRRHPSLAALVAATRFALLTDPWESGVLVVAFALVAPGLFAATAWTLWRPLDRPRPPRQPPCRTRPRAL